MRSGLPAPHLGPLVGNRGACPFREFRCLLIPVEARDDVDALNQVGQCGYGFLSDAVALRLTVGACAAHPRQDLGRQGDARQLVMNKFRVLKALQGQDFENDRNIQPAHTLQNLGEQLGVVDRLSHNEIDAGVKFAPKSIELAIEIFGGRIEATPDMESCARADAGSGRILAVVELAQQGDESD